MEERKAVEEGEQARGGGGEVGSRALADGPPEFGRHRRFEPLHGEPVEAAGWRVWIGDVSFKTQGRAIGPF